MAFEGVQPIHTEEPLIVKPDHTVANNIAQDSSGLVLFAHMAALRQKSDYEHEKLIQDNALKTEGFALQREKMGQDFTLRSAANTAKETAKDLAIQHATSAAQTITQQNQQRAQISQEMEGNRDKLQLDNVKFRNENPMQWADNLQQFKNAYGSYATADFPTLHNQIKAWETLADDIKVALPDPTDKTGKKMMLMPAAKALAKYDDPNTHDAMHDMFVSSGIIKQEQVDSGKDKWWQKSWTVPKDVGATGILAPFIEGKKHITHNTLGSSRVPLTPKVTPLNKWQSAGTSAPTQEEKAHEWLNTVDVHAPNFDKALYNKVQAKLGLDPTDPTGGDSSGGDTGLADGGGG